MRRRTDTTTPISFAKAYARSETFRALFQDGMSLVEVTAAYLDGDGRHAAKALDRSGAIVYATESMRLTTRLMQLASWLLLHRSVVEGDMTPAQAAEEKRKIRLEAHWTKMDGPGWDRLPSEFRDLVARSLSLRNRIECIDAALGDKSQGAPGFANPVREQLHALAAALAPRR